MRQTEWGNPFQDPNATGKAHVLFGNSAGGFASGTINLSTLNGTNGFTINGVGGGDRTGGAVSDIGDVNQDGIDDIIIGAQYADPLSRNNAGASYVVLGRGATASSPEISLTVSPASALENSGNSFVFTFSSSETATTDLTVNFSVSGTATYDVDYELSGIFTFISATQQGSITIPSGQSSVTLTATPIGEGLIEPDETIIITVEAP